MRKLKIIFIFCTLTFNSISQIESTRLRIYEFINSIYLIEIEGDTYLNENGSPKGLLNSTDSLDFNYMHCMYIDDQYYKPEFWETNLTRTDKDYMLVQINELRKFKWNKERINQKVNLILTRNARKYSKSVIKSENKYWKGKTEVNEIPFKMLIRYSAPIFNKKHNIALVYSSTYSGPLSASWGIKIYLLKSGEWIEIGYDPKGIS